MTAPTGLLSWGQAGNYQAANDRAVITALSARKTGLVIPPQITAGAGLVINITGFTGVVDCGDYSNGVVFSNAMSTLTLAAGPSSGTRTDVVWVDIDPAAGSWTLTLRSQADTVGRLGIALGTVTMPTNANTSAQATIIPAPISYGAAAADIGRTVRDVRTVQIANPANTFGVNCSVHFPNANPGTYLVDFVNNWDSIVAAYTAVRLPDSSRPAYVTDIIPGVHQTYSTPFQTFWYQDTFATDLYFEGQGGFSGGQVCWFLKGSTLRVTYLGPGNSAPNQLTA